ncbi:high-affinity iron transporter [Paenibacillus baekrokdamisoli]|nr:FTR1 family protein [Paenibacillus baekrokdamisoli]MBB3072730.1 high-affinity iron transporter [Paenibacillus baekrokdamisoli]
MCLLLCPSFIFADQASDVLQKANDYIVKATEYAKQNDLIHAKEQYDKYNSDWYGFEQDIKSKSKGAYRNIEVTMGEVQYAFAKKPISKDKVLASLNKLNGINQKVISGDLSSFKDPSSSGNTSIEGILQLLNQAKESLNQNDIEAAKEKIQAFRNSWLDVEGIVLTQSSKVYADAERDMVSSYALLTSNPAKVSEAKQTLQEMHDYLAPLANKTSYGMVDVVTILLREGLEALLVIVALLGFLKKSGQGEKKNWIWYGLGAGALVSVILGIVVQQLFSSGTFGNNNFLIAGCTGLFAAVMLIYMSYWLHSKSSLSNWRMYINGKSSKALASGSLWSLSILSFLAVFREGTETVLFFIGMASSISLTSLLGGIALGVLILIVVAFLILKVGLKIPMRPFFLISSILVFYLCFKFLGMGIHGLQLAGVLRATHSDSLPVIDMFGLYPTWENIIPQGILLLAAIIVVISKRFRDQKIQQQLKVNHI